MKTSERKSSIFFTVVMLFLFTIVVSIQYHAAPYATVEAEFMKQPYDLDAFHFLRSWLVAAMGAASVVYLIISALTGDIKLSFNRYTAIIGGLAICVLISFVFSPYQELVLKGARDNYEGMYVYLAYFSIALVLGNVVLSKADIRNFSLFMVFIGVITSLVGVLQAVGVNVLEAPFLRPVMSAGIINSGAKLFETDKSVYSFFGNPNYVGSILTLIIPFIYYHFGEATTKKRYIFAGVLFMVYLTLFLSRSEAGFISVPLTLAIFEMYSYGKRSRSHWVTLFAVIIGAFGVGSLISDIAMFAVELILIHGLLIIFVVLFKRFQNKLSARLITGISAGLVTASLIIVAILLNMPDRVADSNYLHQVAIDKNTITLRSELGNFKVIVKDRILTFKTLEGKDLAYTQAEGVIKLSGGEFQAFSFDTEHKPEYDLFMVNPYKIGFFVLNNEFRVINSGLREDTLDTAGRIGPKGYESLGSGRMYIWQSLIPEIMKRPIGYGADTVMPVFPQMDVAGKFNMGKSPYIIVDKAHNTYIQYAINFGLAGAALLLLLNFQILKDSIGRIREDVFGSYIPCIAAVLGFQVNGLFNDSKVFTSIFYWVLIGVLISLFTNNSNKNRSKTLESKI